MEGMIMSYSSEQNKVTMSGSRLTNLSPKLLYSDSICKSSCLTTTDKKYDISRMAFWVHELLEVNIDRTHI